MDMIDKNFDSIITFDKKKSEISQKNRSFYFKCKLIPKSHIISLFSSLTTANAKRTKQFEFRF